MKLLRNKTASSFLEYMVILGIVSAVLLGMNVYVKRGVQAKVKDLTDALIGTEQVVDISPTATITSTTTNEQDATVNTRVSIGGGWRIEGLENIGFTGHSEITDTDVPYTPSGFVPAEEGVPTPQPAGEEPSGA